MRWYGGIDGGILGGMLDKLMEGELGEIVDDICVDRWGKNPNVQMINNVHGIASVVIKR